MGVLFLFTIRKKVIVLYFSAFLALLAVMVAGSQVLYYFSVLPGRSVLAREFVPQYAASVYHIEENRNFHISGATAASTTQIAETAATRPATREVRQEFLDLREYFGNDDIVGHLRIVGTSIDYIVVQTTDNEFYLYHDIWGNASSAGWIFLDYLVDINEANHNMVIYGHNMARDIMFHSIRHYANYNFFREHPIIEFRTLYADYVWEIFAFYVAHIDFPYTHIDFINHVTWEHWLKTFAAASMHETDVAVSTSDRILTLSTCTNTHDDYRFVVQARLKYIRQ